MSVTTPAPGRVAFPLSPLQTSHDIEAKEGPLHYEAKSNGDAVETVDGTSLVSAFAGAPVKGVLRKFWRLYLIGFLVSSSGMYLGFTLTIPGSIVANPGFIQQFGSIRDPVTGALSIDANHIGAWNGINFASQVITQLVSPFFAERFGTRINLYLLTMLMAIAIVMEIVAREWTVFLGAKIFGGLAVGFIGTSTMPYISDITMPQMRGSHLASFAFFFSVGQLIGAIVLEVVARTAPLAYLSAFFSEFAFLGFWMLVLVFLPESPVWLIRKKQDDKAKRALHRLVGNVEGFDLDHEFAVIKHDVELSEAAAAATSSRGSYLACFRGTNLRRTLVSTVPLSLQNFVGSPLMFNSAYFFQQVGLDNPFTGNLIVYAVLLAGVLCSFYLVERVGRRPLLLGGSIVMGVCVLIVGALGTRPTTSATGGALVALCAVWVAAYSVSAAPIVWMFLVEISTPALRVNTSGIACVLQSCSSVLFNYTVPLMLSPQYAGWGAKIGFLFGPLAFICAVVVWFVVPETKCRSYAALDELFQRRVPAWRFASTKTQSEQQADTTDERAAA